MAVNTKAIVEKVNDAFAKNNPEGFLAHCTDEITFTLVGEKTVKGKDAVRKWMASMDSEPPKFTVQHILAEGDVASCLGEMTMKEKDGKTVPYAYSDNYRFRGDKIVELKAFVVKTEPAAATAGV